MPLASSFVLSSKAGKEVIVRPVVDRAERTWRFEIDEELRMPRRVKAAKTGTKAARGANFVCLLTGAAIDECLFKREAKAGRMGAALMAIVAEGNRGPCLSGTNAGSSSTASDIERRRCLRSISLCPPIRAGFRTVPPTGWNFKDLFTARQLVALTTFSDLVERRGSGRWRTRASAGRVRRGGRTPSRRRRPRPVAYADAVATYLAFVVDRMVFYGSSLCGWLSKDNAMGKTMPKQALAMSWDFAEGNPLGKSSSEIQLACEQSQIVLIMPTCTLPASIYSKDAQQN